MRAHHCFATTVFCCAWSFCCACAAPERTGSASGLPAASVAPAAEPVLAQEAEESPEASMRTIDRLAARVDMLAVQLADAEAFAPDGDPAEQRELWQRAVTAFDLRLQEFLEDHPDLTPREREQLERRVIEPFRELQARCD